MANTTPALTRQSATAAVIGAVERRLSGGVACVEPVVVVMRLVLQASDHLQPALRSAGRVVSGRYLSSVGQASQLALFGHEAPAFDDRFAKLERTWLSEDAWFDYAPGWLRGHEALFERLATAVRFRQEERTMYERVVAVPRLVAVLPADGDVPPVVEAARRTLSQRYGEEFTRISLGYYRNGRESVAWHGDYVARKLPNALVATLSVGAPRRFLLRPTGGGQSIGLTLGWGDLIVMGGSCQRTFQHAIPKVAQADPRIAIMFRPTWTED